MKQTLSFFIIVLSLLSCKSHKDVSRSLVTETKGESFVTVSDTSKAHREILHKVDAAKQENRLEYSKTTEFGSDNNVESITERYIFLFYKLDFKSQLDKIKLEDLRYTATVVTSDTTSTVITEQVKENTEVAAGSFWGFILLGAVIALAFMAFINFGSKYLERNIKI